MQNQDNRGGYDIAGISALGIEKRDRRYRHGLDASRRPGAHALLHHATGGDFRAYLACGRGDGGHGRVVEQEVAGSAICGDGRAASGQGVTLEELRNDDNCESLPLLKRASRGHHIGNRTDDLNCIVGSDTAQKLPGGSGIVLIDRDDRHFAYHLAQIGLGIQQAINDDRKHHDRKGGPVLEYRRKGAPELSEPNAHDATSFASRKVARGRRTISSMPARTA